MEDFRHVLLQCVASLTLCDHMGDVSNVVDQMLKRLDIDVEWNDFPELQVYLHEKGITTLVGTSLSPEYEEES